MASCYLAAGDPKSEQGSIGYYDLAKHNKAPRKGVWRADPIALDQQSWGTVGAMGLRWRLNQCMVGAAVRLLKATGWYRGYWNHWRGQAFDDVQRQGLHVMPVHFYSPIPNTLSLPESLWEESAATPGVDLNCDRGFELLEELAAEWGDEFNRLPIDSTADPQRFNLNNSAYRFGDAEILYSIVRRFQPKRFIEIGAGHSTLLTAEAIRQTKREDADYQCHFMCIEPYPPGFLDPPPEEVTRRIDKELQCVAVAEFTSLEAGDVLFIDSTHVVRIGSDVVYEFLQLLPQLAPGVIVHIHDIFLPYEYPRSWVHDRRFFWNEQYVLQAFLAFNRDFEVLLPTHAMFRRSRERFIRSVPSCAREGSSPTSFWLRRRVHSA